MSLGGVSWDGPGARRWGRRAGLWVCVVAAVLGAAAVAGEDEPLWEAGLFGGAARLPHYRGADEYRVYVLPLPFLIYRGEVLQADKDGLRGIFYRGVRVETDLSVSGHPPVESDSRARRGMDELHPLVEAGPAVRLYVSPVRRAPSVYAQAAVRGVLSVDVSDLGIRREGHRAELGLVLKDLKPGGDGGVDVRGAGRG